MNGVDGGTQGDFIDEPIEPITAGMDAAGAAPGAPMLPRRFRWRDREYAVAAVIETWKTTGPCRHGSGERYVRKHWYRVRTETGEEMRLYFERKARSARERTTRWWLYTVRGG